MSDNLNIIRENVLQIPRNTIDVCQPDLESGILAKHRKLLTIAQHECLQCS